MDRNSHISRLLAMSALLALIAAVAALPCYAQDSGVRDSCKFTSGTWLLSGDQESTFSVELWAWTDNSTIHGASLPFWVHFDMTGFDPEEWNMHLVTIECPNPPDLSVWVTSADSLIVVDTFIYDAGMVAQYETYRRSLADCGARGSDTCFGYNGFLLGILNLVPPFDPFLQVDTWTKIGDLNLRITDPGRLPDSFHIEVDSLFFPPAGTFKYVEWANLGFSPVFTKSVIIVEKYTCGDADDSGAVDIDDAVFMINYIFSGGPPPDPIESGDADCSGGVDIDDVVYLIGYIFSGGYEPCDIDGDGVPDC